MKNGENEDEAMDDPSNPNSVDEKDEGRPKLQFKRGDSKKSSNPQSQSSKGKDNRELPRISGRIESRRNSSTSELAQSKKSGQIKKELLPSLLKNSKLSAPSPIKKKVTLPPEDDEDAFEEQDVDAQMDYSEPEDNDPLEFDMKNKPEEQKSGLHQKQSSQISRPGNGLGTNKMSGSRIDPFQETQHVANGHAMADDNPQIANELPGQSNANKKSKLPVKVRFPDEESSASKGSRSSKMSSFLEVDSKDLNEQFVEERVKQEYDRFFPVFKEVYKLRTLKKKGYKVDKADFFVAYLQGIKKADEARAEEQRSKNKEFFDSVRKIIEYQDKRTEELMMKLQERQSARRYEIEERIANLGQFMLSDFKKQKAEIEKASASKVAKEKEYYNFLTKMGFQPNPMMQNVRLG